MDLAISVSAKRCAVGLAVITGLLILASMAASLLSFADVEEPFLREVRESVIRLTWVDGEANVPAWYSAVLLLLSALLLGVITLAQGSREGEKVAGWLLLTVIFLFLSLDEVAQFHELAITPLRSRFEMSGFFYYAWIIPAAITVLFFVLGYLKFLAGLPARTRWLFLLAGAVYVGGALGVEAVSGRQASLHGEQNLTYHAIITVEELFEMAGIIIFIYALLDYMGSQFTRLTFHVTSDA